MKQLKTLTPPREIHFIAEANQYKSYRKYYVTDRQRRELISEVKETGLVLFEYFLSLIQKDDAEEITDQRIATHFGWDLAKAKRIRQSLIKNGWYRSECFTYSGGRKGTTYYLGKYQVKHGRTPANGVPQMP
jgi:hypothetical protein